jgi:hypothetical protein
MTLAPQVDRDAIVAAMRKHLLIVAATFVGSMFAVPFFCNHKMSLEAWLGGMIAFAVLPFIVGVFQEQPGRAIAMIAGTLLLLCPTVYVAADRLDVEFERLRDRFFLGTATTVNFVCSAWLANSLRARNWAVVLGSGGGLALAVAAVAIMLWMFLFFE